MPQQPGSQSEKMPSFELRQEYRDLHRRLSEMIIASPFPSKIMRKEMMNELEKINKLALELRFDAPAFRDPYMPRRTQKYSGLGEYITSEQLAGIIPKDFNSQLGLFDEEADE